MTTTETVADILAELSTLVDGERWLAREAFHSDMLKIRDRIESALASAEPVAIVVVTDAGTEIEYPTPANIGGAAMLSSLRRLPIGRHALFAQAKPPRQAPALGTPLYHAANRLMLVIGRDGDITSRAPECDALMEALRDIDGGEYKPAAKVEVQSNDADAGDLVGRLVNGHTSAWMAGEKVSAEVAAHSRQYCKQAMVDAANLIEQMAAPTPASVPDVLRSLYAAAKKGFYTYELCGTDKKYQHVSKFQSLDDLQDYHSAWIAAMVSVRDAPPTNQEGAAHDHR